jgi:hypothetical protein
VTGDRSAVAVRDLARPLHRLGRVEAAVVETLAYSDVYDWPLTAAEVHRFLPIAASPTDVDAALATPGLVHLVASVEDCHMLRGREHLAGLRRRRAAACARLWPQVVRRGRMLARIPFVRMVAVSGSLAAGAAADGDDVDLFIVTDDGRLWLSRALAIAAGRLPPRHGATLCPNYMLAASRMELAERDLYTAHELAQLVPLFGRDTYAALLQRNRWYREFLPNHPGWTRDIAEPCVRHSRRLLSAALPGPLASRMERWEMERKVARLRTAPGASAEACFDASTCKGHLDGHRQRFWVAFRARLDALEACA